MFARSARAVLVVLTAVVLAGGCGGSGEKHGVECDDPGDAQACSCAGQPDAGTMVCQDDGYWSDCDCSTPFVDDGTGGDANTGGLPGSETGGSGGMGTGGTGGVSLGGSGGIPPAGTGGDPGAVGGASTGGSVSDLGGSGGETIASGGMPGVGGAPGMGGAPGTGGSPDTGGASGVGGVGTGGMGTGGMGTGGMGTGGEGTGGDGIGGTGTGGEGTGGESTGGEGTGGEGTGGEGTGGEGTGGEGAGGAGGCQPATCGTHKWACWRMPNPPGTGPNPASYAVSDGIVHDEVTCLDWEESPSGSYTVSEAVAHCASLGLGGYDDWRLPTRVEMSSIMDWTRGPTTPDVFSAQSGFHHTGSNWILTITQTGAGAGTDFAWAFNMADGIVSNAYSAANSSAVRCVRGNGSGEGVDDPAVAPPDQYTILSDDEAQDNYTRLIWQRDGDSSGLISWDDAVSYCDGLSLGGRTWRLPTVRELATLVDEATVAPSINETVFPNTHYGARSDNWYWASHQARNSSAAWGLNFDDGFTGFNSGSAAWNTFGPSYAKCVSDE